MIPFCVVGSESKVAVNGKAVTARRTRFGIVNGLKFNLVEDPNHCDFVHLRNFLASNHLQDLIESTAMIHYETFRTRQLLALKESTTLGRNQEGQ